MTVDTFAEAEALVDGFGPRGAGSDAERRAASHLAGRLRDLGREAELEPFSAWPRWPLAYAIHAGLAVAGSDPQLVKLSAAIAEETGAAPITNRAPSDGHAARSAGIAAITITCRDERGWASRRLDESALARAEKFRLELIARLDAEVGPGLAAAHAHETALSES